jgi:hypothetical protein
MAYNEYMNTVRPKTLKEVVGNKEAIMSFRRLLTQSPPPMIISIAPSGIGRTLSLMMLFDELKLSPIRLSKDIKEYTSNVIEIMSKRESILSFFNSTKSVLIIDRLERDIYTYYKTHGSSIPIVVFDNHVHLSIRKHCPMIVFQRPHPHDIALYYVKILKLFKKVALFKDIEYLVSYTFCDIRHGVNVLYTLIFNNKEVFLKNIRRHLSDKSFKDTLDCNKGIFKTLQDPGLSLDKKIGMLSNDTSIIVNIIYENYQQQTTLQECVDISDWFSWCDIDKSEYLIQRCCIINPILKFKECSDLTLKNELMSLYNKTQNQNNKTMPYK